MSATPPSPKTDQNNQTNQTDESNQQQIAPQTGELDAEQLDKVAGGGGFVAHVRGDGGG